MKIDAVFPQLSGKLRPLLSSIEEDQTLGPAIRKSVPYELVLTNVTRKSMKLLGCTTNRWDLCHVQKVTEVFCKCQRATRSNTRGWEM
jgi:hypothetical protein